MHIFLTGEKRAGKSALIKTFLQSFGLCADGFMTYWEQTPGGGRILYLSKYSAEPGSVERFVLAKDPGGTGFRCLQTDKITAAFDKYGVEILNVSGKRDVIVMDEIGFLETKAARFRQEVMRHLDGNVPVVGVVRAASDCTDGSLADAVRAHPNVQVYRVSRE